MRSTTYVHVDTETKITAASAATMDGKTCDLSIDGEAGDLTIFFDVSRLP